MSSSGASGQANEGDRYKMMDEAVKNRQHALRCLRQGQQDKFSDEAKAQGLDRCNGEFCAYPHPFQSMSGLRDHMRKCLLKTGPTNGIKPPDRNKYKTPKKKKPKEPALTVPAKSESAPRTSGGSQLFDQHIQNLQQRRLPTTRGGYMQSGTGSTLLGSAIAGRAPANVSYLPVVPVVAQPVHRGPRTSFAAAAAARSTQGSLGPEMGCLARQGTVQQHAPAASMTYVRPSALEALPPSAHESASTSSAHGCVGLTPSTWSSNSGVASATALTPGVFRNGAQNAFWGAEEE